jgi:hypothetical protein
MPEPKKWSGNLVIRADQPRSASIAILPRFPAEGVRQIRFIIEDNLSRLIGRQFAALDLALAALAAPDAPAFIMNNGERALRAANIALNQLSISPLRACGNVSEAPSSIGQYLKPHSNLNDNARLQTDFD